MKRLFILLAMVVSFTASNATNREMVAPAVVASFQKTFGNASEVSWSSSRDFYKVQFLLNNQYITAFYAEDGEMLALTKNISSTQLPILLDANLRMHYEGYWISELIECSTSDDVAYYVTLENANEKIILKSYSSNWSVQKKIKR